MGFCPACPAGKVEGFPKLSSRVWVGSNFSLKISLGSEVVSFFLQEVIKRKRAHTIKMVLVFIGISFKQIWHKKKNPKQKLPEILKPSLTLKTKLTYKTIKSCKKVASEGEIFQNILYCILLERFTFTKN